MSGVETNGSVEIKMPERTKVRDEPDEGMRRGTVENTCGGILIWWCRGEKSMGIDMERVSWVMRMGDADQIVWIDGRFDERVR